MMKKDLYIVYARDKGMAEMWGLICYQKSKRKAMKKCKELNKEVSERYYFTFKKISYKPDKNQLKVWCCEK